MAERRKTLGQCDPGSLDELLAIRTGLVAQFQVAPPSAVAQITAKLLDVDDRICAMRKSESRKLEESVGIQDDEEFDPDSV